jgi:hypothetical protein
MWTLLAGWQGNPLACPQHKSTHRAEVFSDELKESMWDMF